MKNWKCLFPSHILSRGEELYEEGCVENLEACRGFYSATVQGSETYEVTIFTEGGRMADLSCTCPYARDHGSCKHIAAVLFAIEREGVLPVSMGKEQPMGPAALVQSMSDRQVRDFLTALAQNDAAIYRELTLRYGKLSAKAQQQLLFSELDRITAQYTSYGDDIISCDDDYDYAADLADFVRDRPMSLLKDGGPQMVLETALAALEEYNSQELEDPDSSSGYEIELAVKALCGELLEACTPQQKRLVFEALTQYREKNKEDWIISDLIASILEQDFQDASFSVSKLELVEGMLQQSAAMGYPPSEGLLQQKYQLLRSLPDKAAEFRNFRQQYWHLPCIRQAELALLKEQNWLEEAVQLLLECRNADAAQPKLVQQETEELICLYGKLQQPEHQKTELLYHVRTFMQRSLDYLLQLKALLPSEEWDAVRSEYLKRGQEFMRPKLMQQEGLWQELLEEITAQDSLYALESYAADLLPRFPAQFFELYTRLLQEKADRSKNRTHYHSLMKDLKQLASYEGGAPHAAALAARWRTLYCRRSAMMDELMQAGY